MKILIASALLVSSSAALAHDSCDVDLNAGIRVNQSGIEVFKNNQSLYKIADDQYLVVDGQSVSLTPSQSSLVREYASSIRAVVPEVKTIALEGVDLAIEGVNLAFGELLGENSDTVIELTKTLTDIRSDVNYKFDTDSEQGFYIGEQGFEDEQLFGDEFEAKIESAVEEAMRNSIGSLLVAVGQEMLFSGGDMAAFEQRMESFGQRIEHQMESKGEAIEKRADDLCKYVLAIDELEEQLKQQVSAWPSTDVIVVDHHKRHKA